MNTLLINEKLISNSPTVIIPKSNLIIATHTGILNLSALSNKLKIVCKFLCIQKSLLLFSSICDKDSAATFSKYDMCITKNRQIILRGIRDKRIGL